MRVRISGQMPWRLAVGQTLVGVIQVSDPTLGKEAVLLGASYDAISPVPALAPGVEEPCGVAGLLELVREFSIRPPRRTVVLVLTAGQFKNLAPSFFYSASDFFSPRRSPTSTRG